jgi:glutamine amidotransferase-like uncharacterized protein
MQNKKIGLYISDGVASSTVNVWIRHYKKGIIKDLYVLKVKDFTLENLSQYSCIILPGGSGSMICNTLGPDARQSIIDYVKQGGSLLGVCAGAYAVSSGYDWSLGIINFELIDKKNAHRGESNISFKMTELGRKILNLKDDVMPDVYYHNGPVWKIYEDKKEFTSNILATFEDDIYSINGNPGEAPGTPAIIYEDFGAGKVIAISPHFEKSKGYDHIIKSVIMFLTSSKK